MKNLFLRSLLLLLFVVAAQTMNAQHHIGPMPCLTMDIVEVPGGVNDDRCFRVRVTPSLPLQPGERIVLTDNYINYEECTGPCQFTFCYDRPLCPDTLSVEIQSFIQGDKGSYCPQSRTFDIDCI